MKNLLLFFTLIGSSFFANAQDVRPYTRPHEINAVTYRSTYDDASARGDIEQYMEQRYGKHSLLTDTIEPITWSSPDAKIERRAALYQDKNNDMGIRKEKVLVAYYIQTNFGVSNRTGAIIIETDAFQKDIPQGGDPAPLLTDLLAALEKAGELRGVNLKRPRANYVEILSVAPVVAGSAIYSTRLQSWQDAQNVKK